MGGALCGVRTTSHLTSRADSSSLCTLISSFSIVTSTSVRLASTFTSPSTISRTFSKRSSHTYGMQSRDGSAYNKSSTHFPTQCVCSHYFSFCYIFFIHPPFFFALVSVIISSLSDDVLF